MMKGLQSSMQMLLNMKFQNEKDTILFGMIFGTLSVVIIFQKWESYTESMVEKQTGKIAGQNIYVLKIVISMYKLFITTLVVLAVIFVTVSYFDQKATNLRTWELEQSLTTNN